MEQRVEPAFVLRVASSQDSARFPGDAAGRIHLTGVAELLQGIKQQNDDLFLGSSQRLQCGIVETEA